MVNDTGFSTWQAANNDIGAQIKTLSIEDQDLIRRAAMLKITEQNATQFTEFTEVTGECTEEPTPIEPEPEEATVIEPNTTESTKIKGLL